MNRRKNFLNLKKCFASLFAIIVFCGSCILFGCENRSQPVDTGVNDDGYYDAYLAEKIKKINGIAENNEISKSFYFITDLHWEFNTKKSPYLVNKIRSETDVNTIVFGGDYLAKDYENTDDALKIMSECIDSFNSDDYFAIIGNHELNTQLNQGTPKISDIDCINTINKNHYDTSYFKITDSDEKICSVFLNTNSFTANSAQYGWLKDLLLSLDENWTTLIFMHIYNAYKPSGVCLERDGKGELLDNLLEENKADIKCSVAGVFSGHTHRDYFNYNYFGAPVISTTCDSLGSYYHCDNLYARASGTSSEQAFDVVQIDLIKKKVFLTRIGAGADRIYYYK